MAVLVEDVMQAKSGKSLRVKLGGTWYGAKLDSGLNSTKGQMIEAEIKTLEKFGPWIEAWRPSALPGQVPVPASPHATPRTPMPPVEPKYAEPAKPGTTAPYWLPMASNTVNAAIQAGLIKDPQQIGAWLLAVKVAAESHDETPPF